MNRHESMRGYFAFELYQRMKMNKAIVLICADLGYKVFDKHFEDMPKQCYNTGAAEQASIDVAVGMALSGKIPFVYSITPFLIYRPFETLRTYLHHEKIAVKLVGSGRNYDYKHDGISHFAQDAETILSTLPNILTHWPQGKEEVPEIVQNMIKSGQPEFISLKR